VPLTDLTLPELRAFRADVSEPDDFDAFWESTLAESRALSRDPVRDAVAGPIETLAIEDLTFSGFGGDPIRAWITRPRDDRPRPAVVEYLGYGGGRGRPGERLHWASAGYVHVLMDTRGQGSGWGSGGDTADPHGSAPAGAGFMTRGIESPQDYYYRRVFTDAVLLIDVVRALPGVDPDRIAVRGTSQGGGITLAVAALSPHVRAAMPEVPFLCCFRRSVALTPKPPFTEIRDYLAVHRDRDEQVYDTLSYFDGVAFARRATAPALFSAALMDDIVLPSSVFGAFNAYIGEDREIAVYEHNGHEGGQHHHWLREAAWLAERLGA
jgi:cephalosporin-C deacetylase